MRRRLSADQPEADSRVADQSADESAPGTKRKAGGHKKKAKKKKAGFTNKGRVTFKGEGGCLATGQTRTCIPDALFVLLSNFTLSGTDVQTVRFAIMGADLYEDALFSTAQTYVRMLGLVLTCVTTQFMLTGGPAYNLLKATAGCAGRLFLVQLLISHGPDDPEPDEHCVAYDGCTIRDNNQYVKVKEVDEDDIDSPNRARMVFDSLYPTMQVRIKNVFELLPNPDAEPERLAHIHSVFKALEEIGERYVDTLGGDEAGPQHAVE